MPQGGGEAQIRSSVQGYECGLKANVVSRRGHWRDLGLELCLRPHRCWSLVDIGSLFMRFWDGTDSLPLPSFTNARPNALRAARRATAGRHHGTFLARQMPSGRSSVASTHWMVAIFPPLQAFGQTNNWGWFAAPSWRITSPTPPSTIFDTALARFAIDGERRWF